MGFVYSWSLILRKVSMAPALGPGRGETMCVSDSLESRGSGQRGFRRLALCPLVGLGSQSSSRRTHRPRILLRLGWDRQAPALPCSTCFFKGVKGHEVKTWRVHCVPFILCPQHYSWRTPHFLPAPAQPGQLSHLGDSAKTESSVTATLLLVIRVFPSPANFLL